MKTKQLVMESYIESLIKGNSQAFKWDLQEKADVEMLNKLNASKPDFAIVDELS